MKYSEKDLNVISKYAENTLRNILIKTGMITPRDQSKIKSDSQFYKDIEVDDFMDTLEILYCLEIEFGIIFPDSTKLTDVKTICDLVAKLYLEKRGKKLESIYNNIAKDVIQMLYEATAQYSFIPSVEQAEKINVYDILSKSTPDYDLNLFLKSVKSKYKVDIFDFLAHITDVNSLIEFIALEIARKSRSRSKRTYKEHKYKTNDVKANSKYNIMVNFGKDLEVNSFVDTTDGKNLSLNSDLEFNTIFDYTTLAALTESRYQINIIPNVYKMNKVEDLCELILKKRLANFQRMKAQKIRK
ncbi:MAG: hypothetical protein IKZ49_01710 [Alphaproteobacteria bacterium]|nr:hypothetical protein [Alphaproteobacteria bacterium]